MNLLSQKVDSVLGTVRALREENAKLKLQLANASAQAEDQKNLLDSANAKLADFQAALDARANQAVAQDQIINEKNRDIENLNSQINEKNGIIDSLNGQINEKNGIIDDLNGQVNEKNNIIDCLNGQVAEKNGIIDDLNNQIQNQSTEIAEAQNKFQQLVSTIETELDTEINIKDQANEEVPAQPAQENHQEENPDLFASNGGSQPTFFG